MAVIKLSVGIDDFPDFEIFEDGSLLKHYPAAGKDPVSLIGGTTRYDSIK